MDTKWHPFINEFYATAVHRTWRLSSSIRRLFAVARMVQLDKAADEQYL
jgi:hypothetical protein